MRVLVTGAAGFIGFHVCRRLLRDGDDVVGIDSLNDYYDPSLKERRLSELGVKAEAAREPSMSVPSAAFPGLSFCRLSIENTTEMQGLFARRPFDCVIHMAAQAGVRYSLENPRAYVDANVTGFLNVLEGCRTRKIRHLVFASSSSVYGLSQRLPFSEHEHTDHPASVYAATKKADEMMAHAYSQLFGLPATGLRFFTVYGPWGRPDMAYYKFAVSITEGRPVELFNNGDMTRDFTYIDDAVDAVVSVARRAPVPAQTWDPRLPDPASSSAPYRIYNIGNNRPESLRALLASLELCLGRKAVEQPRPMQPGDVKATQADVRDLARDFGWKPTTSLNDGIAQFVQWFKEYRR